MIYLDSDSPTLVKRFSETRRKHPLTSGKTGLREALELESQLLDGISSLASLKVDTTNMTIHELRDLVSSRVAFPIIHSRCPFSLLPLSQVFQ